MYIDKLYYIINKYNNPYHITIKIKSIDVTLSTDIDFNKTNNKEDPKFMFVDHGRISNYKNIFAKDYEPNWSIEVFVVIKAKNTIP